MCHNYAHGTEEEGVYCVLLHDTLQVQRYRYANILYGTDHNASMIYWHLIMQQTSYCMSARAIRHNIGTRPRACGPRARCQYSTYSPCTHAITSTYCVVGVAQGGRGTYYCAVGVAWRKRCSVVGVALY